jgi:hypothetical protein
MYHVCMYAAIIWLQDAEEGRLLPVPEHLAGGGGLAAGPVAGCQAAAQDWEAQGGPVERVSAYFKYFILRKQNIRTYIHLLWRILLGLTVTIRFKTSKDIQTWPFWTYIYYINIHTYIHWPCLTCICVGWRGSTIRCCVCDCASKIPRKPSL